MAQKLFLMQADKVQRLKFHGSHHKHARGNWGDQNNKCRRGHAFTDFPLNAAFLLRYFSDPSTLLCISKWVYFVCLYSPFLSFPKRRPRQTPVTPKKLDWDAQGVNLHFALLQKVFRLNKKDSTNKKKYSLSEHITIIFLAFQGVCFLLAKTGVTFTSP